jgi:hypothetical protein
MGPVYISHSLPQFKIKKLDKKKKKNIGLQVLTNKLFWLLTHVYKSF